MSLVFVDDGKEMELADAERTLFSVYLNPKFRHGLKLDSSDENENEDTTANNDLKLYKCSEDAGTYRIFEIKTGKLLQSDLNSNVSSSTTFDTLIEHFGTIISEATAIPNRKMKEKVKRHADRW